MTRTWLNRLPSALILLRGVLGLACLIIAFFGWDPTGWVLATMVVLGVVSDVFDGVVARRLGVSSERLRILDSRVDVLFFVCLVAALMVRSPDLLPSVTLFFALMATMELSVHLISFLRFRRQSSTHHYLSKLFSLFLFGLVVQLFLLPIVTWYFWVVLSMAVVSYLEAALIMLRLKSWQCDVRSVLDVREGVFRKPSGSTPRGD